ncbi:hypothetical protein SAMN05216207_101098 [Pseudonocardia ammonioxydans]|uniref:PPE family protein n=1 Tax=Pseudonocardia ammonioxydans TaxID=260086 RepID=A0A1I4X783_PSUAM|nr:hypothetical protein [Pseudonocardia ammonioxydans]SFN21565.1 hypothetical protein SAMN05216207_101098 [Pseudonocardia ammonioxydans]
MALPVCYNFEAFDMATKFAWVNDQPGMAAAQQVSDGLTTLTGSLETARTATDDATSRLGISWQGPAAEAARTSLTATADGVSDSATIARNGADRMLDHGHSFEAMRRQITYLDPADYSWVQRVGDNLSEAWHSAWGAGADHVTIAEHNQVNDEVANRALQQYATETSATDDRFTTAAAPPPDTPGASGAGGAPGPAGAGPGAGAFGTGSPGSGGPGDGGAGSRGAGDGGVGAGAGGAGGVGGAGTGGNAGPAGGPRPPEQAGPPTGGAEPRAGGSVLSPDRPGSAATGPDDPRAHAGDPAPRYPTTTAEDAGQVRGERVPAPLPERPAYPAAPERSAALPAPFLTAPGTDPGRARDELARRFAEGARQHQPARPTTGPPDALRGPDQPRGPAGRGAGPGAGAWATEPRAPGGRAGVGEPAAWTGRGADPGRGAGTPGYGPMMGGAAPRDGQDHRNRYIVPTDEVFAVEVTATDAVLGPEQDPR